MLARSREMMPKALRIDGEGASGRDRRRLLRRSYPAIEPNRDRPDRRLAENHSGKRQVVVAMRELAGRTRGSDGTRRGGRRADDPPASLGHPAESTAWTTLHAGFAVRRINYQDGYSLDGACTIHTSPISRVCAAAKSAITTISPGRILSATPRKPPGGKTSAASKVYGVVGLPMRCSPSVAFCGVSGGVNPRLNGAS
jgi:hypothetical protein